MIIEELAPQPESGGSMSARAKVACRKWIGRRSRANRLDSLRGGSPRKSPPRQLQPTYRPLTRDTPPRTPKDTNMTRTLHQQRRNLGSIATSELQVREIGI
jgi:hypothetical protein